MRRARGLAPQVDPVAEGALPWRVVRESAYHRSQFGTWARRASFNQAYSLRAVHVSARAGGARTRPGHQARRLPGSQRALSGGDLLDQDEANIKRLLVELD